MDTVIAVTRATVRGMWWSKKTSALVARSKERRLSTTSVCPLKTNSPKTTLSAARRSLNDKVLASSVYSQTHRVWLASYSRQRNEAKRARSCVDILYFVMQANELQDFAGRGHGDLVGTLGGYLSHRTACAAVLLPPPLEGLLPFLGFITLGFLHRDTSPERLQRPCDASGEHAATLSRTQRVYVAWSQEQHEHSVMPG